jgi:hypothetical protein
VIFGLMVLGAFLWRFTVEERVKKRLHEFEFVPETPEEEEFELKAPQREILHEQLAELPDEERHETEERPDIQITPAAFETEVREETVQTDRIEVMEDIDVETVEMDIEIGPEEIEEIVEETAFPVLPIAAVSRRPVDLFKYREPVPHHVRKVALLTQAPVPGRTLRVKPAQFGDLEAPTIGELGPIGVNLFGDGEYLRAVGGSGGMAAQTALQMALQWLALHQEPDGRWIAHKWDPEEVRPDGSMPAGSERKGATSDVSRDGAVTGLGAMAFMGGGHTIRKGEYRVNVRRALEWILRRQNAETGRIGTGTQYEHAICTIALCEAYGRTPDDRIGLAARKAVDWCVSSVNHDSGWRYQPRSPQSDMSVTGWFVQALKTAKLANIRFDHRVFSQALTFVDRLTNGGGTFRSTGAVGYTYEEDMKYGDRPSMTAVGMMIRQFTGMGVKSSLLVKGAERMKAAAPNWEQKFFYHWYYATYAMYNMGGEYRVWWNSRVRDVLLNYQSKNGHQAGSWNPERDRLTGGRVYCTALGALCLEVYYRYGEALRSFGTAPDLEDLFFR